ncbi:MAG: glycerol-3-phosphate dehydrogenase/oxidase [Deltaproteobacteria bacterium]|nr:glycerol-3-phosphate dehydrogenase/oxidase [Deltaproteobacteria bacterium]
MINFDLIIIGGGINACGMARDASLRGLKVAVVEKNDLACAASGYNSQMIHGGVRYLLGDMKTTRLACLDSGYIQKIAPFLLFRIPFLFPVLGNPKSLSKKLYLELLETFFEAYDHYAPLKNGKKHCRFSAQELLQLEPGLNPGLVGGISFDEWGIDAPRLTVLNAKDAQEHGAQIFTHTKVVDLLKKENQILGVKVKEQSTGKTQELFSKIVFNVAGPWIPSIAKSAGVEVKLRPAKGIHLLLDRQIIHSAVMSKAIDGRSIFMMPYQNSTILGTTDDDYFGDPDLLEATQDEVEYLLEGIESIYPSIRQHKIIDTWAALRPTLYERGKYEDDLTREYEIFDHEKRDGLKGFLTIAGGKLASYRIMSEEAIDAVCKKLNLQTKCSSHLKPLPGAETELDVEDLAKEKNIPLLAAARLYYRHGNRAEQVSKLFPSQKIICECDPVLEAEIRYAIREEWAKNFEDVARRTRWSLGPCQGQLCLQAGARVIGEELGWSESETQLALEEYVKLRKKKMRWVN